MSGTFSFADYDVVGFDLDNCLCRYHVSKLLKLEYDTMATYIIQTQKYPNELLSLPYEQGEDFVMKGLFLDPYRGNILKISPEGTIIQASHGTRLLSSDEIEKIYGGAHWELTDKYISDPLFALSQEYVQRIKALTDYFYTPCELILGRIVDSMDKNQSAPCPYNIYPDILEAFHDMFDDVHFATNHGGYYKAFHAEPSKYIRLPEEHIAKWLTSLKESGKILFLLTGSNTDYASFIAENALGCNWKDFFHVIIFKAQKPGFWNLDRSFKNLDGEDISINDFKIGGNYKTGNFKALRVFLQKITKKCDPKIVYIGDSIIDDVYSPNKFCGLDTVAIIEELEAEGLYGYERGESDNSKAIRSDFWGSFFTHGCNSTKTIWKNFIMKHSVFLAPSISALARKPVDYRYCKKIY